MEDNTVFDFDTIMDELSVRLEDVIEEVLVEQIDNAVTRAVQDAFPEALSESFSDFVFILKDGTIARPRQRMKLFSPDKSKLLLCYGGLRIDGSSLMVQTRISSWESIAYYNSKEEAVEALIKVKNAMDANLSIFEL